MTAVVESISPQRQRVRTFFYVPYHQAVREMESPRFYPTYAYLATERPSLLFLEGENTAKAVHQRQIMLHLAQLLRS